MCPVCGVNTEMLTTRQAATLVQTKPQSVRRWLARGQAHGVRTVGGAHRVCRNSLFALPVVPSVPDDQEIDLAKIGPALALERFQALK